MRLNLFVLALLLLTACSAQPATTPPPITHVELVETLPPATIEGCAATSEEPVKFLALGDSYTIGESVDEAERWPVQLAALLRNQGFSVDDPQIIARTGWTTDELSAAIDAADPQGPYDLVSLLIGVNNQYRGRDSEGYRIEFIALLQRAIGFAGGQPSHVIVLSIPDWGVTPFASNSDAAKIAAEIDTYNAINKEPLTHPSSPTMVYIPLAPCILNGLSWRCLQRVRRSFKSLEDPISLAS
jgi:hypothetical protein